MTWTTTCTWWWGTTPAPRPARWPGPPPPSGTSSRPTRLTWLSPCPTSRSSRPTRARWRRRCTSVMSPRTRRSCSRCTEMLDDLAGVLRLQLAQRHAGGGLGLTASDLRRLLAVRPDLHAEERADDRPDNGGHRAERRDHVRAAGHLGDADAEHHAQQEERRPDQQGAIPEPGLVRGPDVPRAGCVRARAGDGLGRVKGISGHGNH